MALPGELQSQYGSDPGYQAYLAWMAATGGNTMWWSEAAEAAANAAGISRHVDANALGWTQRVMPWGETKWFDPSGAEHSTVNPAWKQFVQSFGGGATANATAAPAPSATTTTASFAAPAPAPIAPKMTTPIPPQPSMTSAAPGAAFGLARAQTARTTMLNRLRRSWDVSPY